VASASAGDVAGDQHILSVHTHRWRMHIPDVTALGLAQEPCTPSPRLL
jgi:hypothetical protein